MLACRPGDDIAVEVYRPEKATDRSVAAKLAAIAADDVYDLVFVHRDADSAGWEAREKEIRSAGEKRAVPVIPGHPAVLVRQPFPFGAPSDWDY